MMHAQDEEEPQPQPQQQHRAAAAAALLHHHTPGNTNGPPRRGHPCPQSSTSNGHHRPSSPSSRSSAARSSASRRSKRSPSTTASSPSSSSPGRCCRRALLPRACTHRRIVAYSLPLWVFAFAHVVLDVRPESYLPRAFLESLSWEWSLGGGGSRGRSVRGGDAASGDGAGGPGPANNMAAAVVSAESVASAQRMDDSAASLSVGAAAIPAEGSQAQAPPNPTSSIISPAIAKRVDEHPYNLLRDVSDVPVNLDMDLPYFWHIHKSGGSTMKHVLYCLGRTQTRRIDEDGCSESEPDLHYCRREFGSVINADASSVPGIERAIKLKLSERVFPEIQGTKAFVVDTSRVYEAMSIFTPYRKGRLFVLFRHPVERAVSKYHYIKIATWEKNYKPEIQEMTMMEYANSRHCYNNWMVRRLVHKMVPGTELTRDDLDLAKEILRRKALVLFTDDIPGAAERVRQYFLWSDEALGLNAESKNCLETHIYAAEPMNANPHPPLDSASPEWKAIREKNLLDIELVSYARDLYPQQGEMIRRILRGGHYGTVPPPPPQQQQGAAAPAAPQPQ